MIKRRIGGIGGFFIAHGFIIFVDVGADIFDRRHILHADADEYAEKCQPVHADADVGVEMRLNILGIHVVGIVQCPVERHKEEGAKHLEGCDFSEKTGRDREAELPRRGAHAEHGKIAEPPQEEHPDRPYAHTHGRADHKEIEQQV